MVKRVNRRQLELFPRANKPTPKEFAEDLISKRLVFACHQGRSGKMKDVRLSLERAFIELEKYQGIDYKKIKKLLRKAPELSAQVFWEEAVESMRRKPAEKIKIMHALRIIAQAANWRRIQKDWAKEYVASPEELAEIQKQKRHLKGIKQEGK